jgi:hypothetical protein
MAHVHRFFLNPLDRGSVEGISQREGTGEGVANVPTATGYNAGTFVASEVANDDAGWPIFSSIGRGHAAPPTTGQLKPMKRCL